MLETLLPWAIFLVIVTGLLALDLGVFHRDAHAITRKESLIWSVVWIGIALGAALLTAIHAVIYLSAPSLSSGHPLPAPERPRCQTSRTTAWSASAKVLPSTEGYYGQRFFVVRNGGAT